MSYWNNPSFALKTQEKNVASLMPLVLPHKCTPEITLQCYENLIKVIPAGYIPPQNTPPDREDFDIKEFSKKSRMKLFTIFNKINYSQYGIPLFISATWHYDSPGEMKTIKLFLKKFRQMLEKFLPPFHYIWKLEYQKRGIPHFHILIFPLQPDQKFYTPEIERLIKIKWMQLKKCKCAHCKNYSIKTIECKTRLMSIAYIAKEIAKVEERYEEHDLGRIWGTSQDLKINMTDEFKTTMKFFNLIIDEKLKENFRNNDLKNYILNLKDTIEPRSIFMDTKKIKDILSNAKVETMPQLIKLKKYSLKRKENVYRTIFKNQSENKTFDDDII